MHSAVVDPETAPSHIVISTGSWAKARDADMVPIGAIKTMARMRKVLKDFRIEDSFVGRRAPQSADLPDAGDVAGTIRYQDLGSRFAGLHLLERVARPSRGLSHFEIEQQEFPAVHM
jgi:hypothetical protein